MTTKSKVRMLVLGGIVMSTASAIAAGVGTYKAYPDIKVGIEAGENPLKIAKSVAKNYIPAMAMTLGTGALLIVGEILGERKVAELEDRAKRMMQRYNTVSKWYQNKDMAVKEVVGPRNQSEIEKLELERDKKDIYGSTEIRKYHDLKTHVEFEASEVDLLRAQTVVNRNLTLHGVAFYEDFYAELGVDIPPEFKGWGWSVGLAYASWVEPWLVVQTAKSEDGSADLLYFSGDRGDSVTMAFEPVSNPENWDE